MPRLLRLHFSSIGHAHARLAPLTLDFRQDQGTGTDTVVWLRNAGGKSSILNLFFSIFRPDRREFLGTNAEGRARRLEDYVKGSDLALVVTEWDVEPPTTTDLFGQPPIKTRIVGQLLAWRGLQRSTDVTRLRRLFFSLRSDPARQITFEQLPLPGRPVAQAEQQGGLALDSFEAFRGWLLDLHRTAPDLEVVSEESHKRWVEHLERIGLDPELFRYQIRMNLREGAADELFRFDRQVDFVRFLLELALDTTRADQVSTNVAQLRERLRHRPELLLEERFTQAALAELEPLELAVERWERARTELQTCRQAAGGVALGLQVAAAQLDGRVASERALAGAAGEEERGALAQQQRALRHANGLTRLGHELALTEARRGLQEAQARRVEWDARHRVLQAAEKLATVQRLESELGALQDALRRSEADREPLIRQLQEAGSRLWELTERGVRSVKDTLFGLEDEARRAAARLDVLRRREVELEKEDARAAEQVRQIDEQLARRDQAQARLRQQGVLDPEEESRTAVARWEERARLAAVRLTEAEQGLKQCEAGLEELEARTREAERDAAQTSALVNQWTRQLERARDQAEQLATHPRLLEVEEAERGDLWAEGLESRLRSRAEAHHRAVLQLRVDAAEDERALQALEQTGLLPPPRDVELVLELLRERGIPCFSGLEYLANNSPEAEATVLLLSDPGRFSGVVVQRPELLRKVGELTGLCDRLRGPVVVSLASLEPGSATVEQVVLPPGQQGSYVPAAAQARRIALARQQELRSQEEQQQRAAQRELEDLARDLTRFYEEFGRDRLALADEQLWTAQARHQAAAAELERCHRQRQLLRSQRGELTARLAAERKEVEAARQAAGRLQDHAVAHERPVDGLREARETQQRLQLESGEELEGVREELEQLRDRRRQLDQQLREQQQLRRQLEEERDAIQHRSAAPVPSDGTTREVVAARYQQLLATYRHEVSENRLQWELEQKGRQLIEARGAYRLAAEGLDPAAPAAVLGADARPEEQRILAEQELSQAGEALGAARQAVRAAEEALRDLALRPQAGELPPEPPPPDGDACFRRAARFLEQAAAAEQEREQALTRRAAHERAAATLKEAATLRRQLHGLLEASVPELPTTGTPTRLPDEEPGLVELVRGLRGRHAQAVAQEAQEQQAVHLAAERVRAVALDEQFAEHRSQVRERLRAPAEELPEYAADYRAKLRDRLTILRRDLDDIDSHRRLLIGALDGVAAEATRLLRRVGPASVLPLGLEGWGGRAYLEIRFDVPGLEAERVARLEPLVDRLVQDANLPGGLTLAQLAVEELAGHRGFDVTILKPDTVLRADRLPITTLSTFSRGQQLTAAVLLYCTLVRLRALSRGRGHQLPDAGVLLLDNPIGTCSSVPLLELQRSVAREMRVQLIYTTGVHDLEALTTLPNTIRLRNAHRDRASGDNHVTVEPPESHLTGVRVVEVE